MLTIGSSPPPPPTAGTQSKCKICGGLGHFQKNCPNANQVARSQLSIRAHFQGQNQNSDSSGEKASHGKARTSGTKPTAVQKTTNGSAKAERKDDNVIIASKGTKRIGACQRNTAPAIEGRTSPKSPKSPSRKKQKKKGSPKNKRTR